MPVRSRPSRPEADAPPRPINETMYLVLRAHIEQGQLPDGLIVGEAAVARAFRASRGPAGAALRRLVAEGLLVDHDGRGYRVGSGPALRLDLEKAGLVLPTEMEDGGSRNRHVRIYPEVEHAVATCLVYGRFLLNESALAERYGVSRTVAHEVLTRLERSGIISQDTNQRWYAGPLTSDDIVHHFQMRQLLEPAALKQAFPRLGREDLELRRARLSAIEEGHLTPARIERLEWDLHHATLAPCGNPLILETVRRSQLPLLATHSAFEQFQHHEEILAMARDHRQVFTHLIEGDVDAAAARLERHLWRSIEPNIALRAAVGPLPEELRQDYLQQVG